MSAVIRFAEATDIVLLRFYLMAMRDFNEGLVWENHTSIAQPAGVSEIVTKKALSNLEQRALIETGYDLESNDRWYQISDKGLAYVDEQFEDITSLIYRNFESETRWVEKLIEDTPSAGSAISRSDISAPASDRYVSTKDNQKEITQLRLKAADLIKAVEDNRDNDFEDKEGLLGELLAFDLLLQQPQISVPLVEKILSETITYLATKFVENAIGIAAKAVLIAAARLFGFSF